MFNERGDIYVNLMLTGKVLERVNSDDGKICSLEDIVVYVPNSSKKSKYFLIIKTGNDIESVNLVLSNSTSKKYSNYICSFRHPIKNICGECEVCVLIIDEANMNSTESSNCLKIQIDSSTFNYKARLNVCENVSKSFLVMYNEIQKMYKNMLEMTDLNIRAIGENKKGG